MFRLLALLLLIAAVVLAVMGYTTYQDATAGISILGLDLNVSDQEAKRTAMMYGGGALLCLIAALGLFRKA